MRSIAVVAAGLALLAAGCSKGTNTSTPPPQSSGAPSPSASASGGSAINNLESLGAQWAKTSAKITYQYTGGTTGTQNLGNFTLFWQPPDAWRMDMTQNGSAFTMIRNGDKSYICSNNQCIETPTSQGGAAVPFLGAFANPKGIENEIAARAAGVDVKTSSETIAGQDATCYAISGNAAGQQGTVQYCFSSSGLLLRYQAESTGTAGAGSFKLEASDVSTTVSPSDFEPPYKVTTIPTSYPTP